MRNPKIKKAFRKLSYGIKKDFLMPDYSSFSLTISEFDGLVITGNHEILSFDNECISVKIGQELLNIRGNELNLLMFSNNETVIGGRIDGVEFLR